MKIFAKLLAFVALFALPCAFSQAADVATVTNPSGFVIHRGTNISHWLSQDFGFTKRSYFITENDFRYISKCGFDHVRLPVDEIVLWKDDGSPDEAAFAMLHDAIGWCAKNHLRVIVDLHSVRAHDFNASNSGKVNTLWNDPKAQDRFIDLWTQLSARLRDFPNDLVAYEIMNEPTAEDPEDWNKLVAKSFKVIRALEPNRVIVIGADRWQIPSMMPKLKVPQGDKNIILSIHTYTPFALTHHEAGWIGEPLKSYDGPVNYPGPIIDKDNLDRLVAKCPGDSGKDLLNYGDNWNADSFFKEIEPAVKRARELGLQLYCGEFGCLPTVPRAARMAYYRDIVAALRADGVAYANWEYKGDFGIFEWHADKDSVFIGAPDDELTDILTGRK